MNEDFKNASAIWLPQKKYPDLQKCPYTIFGSYDGMTLCMNEFRKSYQFGKNAVKAEINVFGDTKFRLYVNEKYVGTGPAAAGGDYDNSEPMPKCYYNYYSVDLDSENVDFYAVLQLAPVVMTDYSFGRGGFLLSAKITFADGHTETVGTDGTWLCRRDTSFISSNCFDKKAVPDVFVNAEIVENIWNPIKAPIPMLEGFDKHPIDGADSLCVMAGEKGEKKFVFDRIYSAYLCFKAECAGDCVIRIQGGEHPESHEFDITLKASQPFAFMDMRMYSIGEFTVSVENRGTADAVISDIHIFAVQYPNPTEGGFRCNDPFVQKLFDVAFHTLKICRQTLHLDSPLHQETLGCTGDYYIESLENYMTLGDHALTRFDIIRTADWLVKSGGVMFHTSYSLIWVRMLLDYYKFSADDTVFADTFEAMTILLERFDGYTNEDGIIVSPPNYMFIDWVPVDGYNLHHPPKALGQTALNAFYYDALRSAVEICKYAGTDGVVYAKRAEKLKKNFDRYFFDSERGLYFEGQTDPDKETSWKPENPQKRYYGKHSNTLAVYAGLCEPKRRADIMQKVFTDDSLIDCQAYFMHFVFEAASIAGIFPEFLLPQLHRWEKPLEFCDKGLSEMWDPRHGDCSHAWGGTAVYQLPSKILGLKMIEPGFRRITLTPDLCGLNEAVIDVPTPFGMIHAELFADRPGKIDIPEGISVKFFYHGRGLSDPTLKNLMDEFGRLTQYPTKDSQRRAFYEYLGEKFQKDVVYTEREVNGIINTWHTFMQMTLLRRELVVLGILDRERDGSRYVKV